MLVTVVCNQIKTKGCVQTSVSLCACEEHELYMYIYIHIYASVQCNLTDNTIMLLCVLVCPVCPLVCVNKCAYYHPLIYGWLSLYTHPLRLHIWVCVSWWPSLIGLVNLVTPLLRASQTQGLLMWPLASRSQSPPFTTTAASMSVSACVCEGEGGRVNLLKLQFD